MDQRVRVNTPSAKSPLGALKDALKCLYEQRWLAVYFVQRQLTSSYKSSFLGLSWLFFSPLLLIVLYTLVFSQFLGLRFREVDSVTNFGLYLYCGLIPYMAFGDTLNQGVASIRSNANLVGKVVFPVEILPLSTAATAFTSQFFGLAGLLVLTGILERELQVTTLLLPLFMISQLFFLLGLGYLAAVAGTFLPDIKETLRAFVRAMFFITPIIFPVDRVPDDFQFLVTYNPLAYVVESWRNLVLDGTIPPLNETFWFSLFSVGLLAVSFALFVRVRPRFGDMI
ncbi:ABC transporter permease [soil metagenome]